MPSNLKFFIEYTANSTTYVRHPRWLASGWETDPEPTPKHHPEMGPGHNSCRDHPSCSLEAHPATWESVGTK